jgi:hypothetical protein
MSHRTRTALRKLFANPLSLAYLALVALAAGFLAYDTAVVHHEDASFAAVPLVLLASPAFFLLTAGGPQDTPMWWTVLALALSVTAQAAALGGLARLVTGRGRAARPGKA